MFVLSITVCLVANLPHLMCHDERFLADRPDSYNAGALLKEAAKPWMETHPQYFVADWAIRKIEDDFS